MYICCSYYSQKSPLILLIENSWIDGLLLLTALVNEHILRLGM